MFDSLGAVKKLVSPEMAKTIAAEYLAGLTPDQIQNHAGEWLEKMTPAQIAALKAGIENWEQQHQTYIASIEADLIGQ